MNISIDTQIGYQGGAAGAGDTNLINDQFSTDKAAGSVNDTAADPGPGTILVTDTGDKLSVSGGSLVISDSVASSDPMFIYSSAVARIVGRMLLTSFTTISTGNHGRIGWGTNSTPQSASFDTGIRFINTASIATQVNGLAGPEVGSFATTTTYLLVVILRAAGWMAFIRGGIYAYWELLFVSAEGSDATLYAGGQVIGAGRGFSCDYFRVPAARWLPTPNVSDGFGGEFGTPDGRGHAEGVAGGVGAGGAGGSWDEAVGTWSATSGQAHSTSRVGGLAYLTISGGDTDVLVKSDVTRVGGTAGIVARYVDDDNHIQLRHSGANIQLTKIVAGVATSLVDTLATYVSGAEICLIVSGTKVRAFYNGEAYGGEQTIADAALQTSSTVGLRTSDDGNLFDNFVVYPRGTGNEYADLNTFAGVGSIQFQTNKSGTFNPSVTVTSGTVTWYYGDGTHSIGATASKTYPDSTTKTVTVVFSEPENVTHLALQSQSLTGTFNLSSLSIFTGLQDFRGFSNPSWNVSGNLSDVPRTVTHLQLYSTSSEVVGSLGDLPSTCVNLHLRNTSSTITGSLSDLSSAMTTLRLGSTTSTITGGAGIPLSTGLANVHLESTTYTQAQIDELVEYIYTYRDNWTDGSPELNVGGSNPAPSGTYQDADPPTTGKEFIYALENDPNSEGFNTWDITYTS